MKDNVETWKRDREFLKAEIINDEHFLMKRKTTDRKTREDTAWKESINLSQITCSLFSHWYWFRWPIRLEPCAKSLAQLGSTPIFKWIGFFFKRSQVNRSSFERVSTSQKSHHSAQYYQYYPLPSLVTFGFFGSDRPSTTDWTVCPHWNVLHRRKLPLPPAGIRTSNSLIVLIPTFSLDIWNCHLEVKYRFIFHIVNLFCFRSFGRLSWPFVSARTFDWLNCPANGWLFCWRF